MQYLSPILPLFCSILFLCMGATVYFLSKGILRNIVLRFCLITFFWQFVWVILFSLNSSTYSDLICKIGYTGIIFLPVSCYETVVQYLGLPKKYIIWFYYLSFGFLISLWTTDMFIKGAYLYPFGYYPEAGILHVGYMFMVCVLMFLILSALHRAMKKEKNSIKKNQLRFIFLSFIFYN